METSGIGFVVLIDVEMFGVEFGASDGGALVPCGGCGETAADITGNELCCCGMTLNAGFGADASLKSLDVLVTLLKFIWLSCRMFGKHLDLSTESEDSVVKAKLEFGSQSVEEP